MTNDRLKAIEQRCKKLGWDCDIEKYHFFIWSGHCADKYERAYPREGQWGIIGDVDNADHLQAAERLLSLYEPGAVVEVGDNFRVCVVEENSIQYDAVEKPGIYKLIPWEATDD